MICNKCGRDYEKRYLKNHKYICPNCSGYIRIPARDRVEMISDKNSFVELFEEVRLDENKLSADYLEKLLLAREKAGISEAVLAGEAKVLGEQIMLVVCDSYFMMGSMGYVVGERITLAIEYATNHNLPLFVFCCSGGARMQEGLKSLMQMEKTSMALAKHADKGLFFSSILTDPTTGGVTASFAMLGDVIMAEKGATIGFTGKRVIKQTIGEELPNGFQSAEFQCEHGMVDGVVERNRIRKMVQFLAITNKKINRNVVFDSKAKYDFDELNSIGVLDEKNTSTVWEKVQMNRKVEALQPLDYVKGIFDIFVELKGDRCFGDDSAIAGGIAMLGNQPVTVIATRRGKSASEIVLNNFGMPSPEGYRKALRLMKQAEKFGRPIVTFINTAGAYPGKEAEERGQGEAIARNLFEMSRLNVPVLAIIVGEACSGGALALAVANEVWMLDSATYSILSPEGYASIVWKDSSRAAEAAEMMDITADSLWKEDLIDRVIRSEENNRLGRNEVTFELLRQGIIDFIKKMSIKKPEEIREDRERRFRKY